MVSGDTRRVVVIKGFRSNVIEEAILILKNEPGNNAGKQGKPNPGKKANREYLLKEAELIINGYMRENNLQPVSGRAFDRYVNEKKKKLLINIGINFALVSSIALLVFLIVKIM